MNAYLRRAYRVEEKESNELGGEVVKYVGFWVGVATTDEES